MPSHEEYMHRCLQLAAMASGHVSPNPMVGAVLVHDQKIIGEGYHKKYGESHAEVNAIAAAPAELLPESTLYVSLEPCAHHGKTPPCANLIIEKKIPRVVIGCRDPFPEVNGKGIEKLRQSGVEVIVDILHRECREINRRFFTFHEKKRPYIILKWAESADGFMGRHGENVRISSPESQVLLHRWRSEEDAILAGTQTVLTDNPQLTNRLAPGKQPLRVILDRNGRIPANAAVFSPDAPTILFGQNHGAPPGTEIISSDFQNILHDLSNQLYQKNILSLLVEGGQKTLQHFISHHLFDEIRIIRSNEMHIGEGIASPVFSAEPAGQFRSGSDTVLIYRRHPHT